MTLDFPLNATFENEKFSLAGKRELEFSPNFTCLIGGRGTGKSTIFNLINEKLRVGENIFFRDKRLYLLTVNQFQEVAVNNAIVLVDYIGKLISKGMHIDEAIVEATVRRAKPIIMTTITTIIGLLPFVIIGDKSSLWYGLSLSVIGGLISSTIMILFFLPSMYRVFNRSRN